MNALATLFVLIAAAAPAAAFATEKSTPVRIDETGVVVIEGRKVFPIGLTLPPPPDAVAPDGRNAFAVLREAGITFIRTGPTAKARWDDAGIATEQRYQDAAARVGLRCLPYLKELSAIPENAPAREARLREVVKRFKDHPGMGLWKGDDEPEWGKHPVGPLVRAKQIIREAGSTQPIWIVQAPRGTVESLKPYDPAYDIVGCDIYPISYPPGTHSLLPNDEISMVGDYTQRMREVADGKPVWMTLQIAWSGVTKPGKTLRFPTFAQQRFMTYQAIINGARGLVYFGGHIPNAWNERDAKLQWNWTFWERVLRPVIDEVGENSPLAAALVAPESKLAVRVEPAVAKGKVDGIEFCVRETDDAIYLLACKREWETVNVRFTGLPGTAGEGEVMFESPRKVKVENGSFTDWFGPFDVHVYRFPKLMTGRTGAK